MSPFVCAARVSTLRTLKHGGPGFFVTARRMKSGQLPAAILPELSRADALIAFTQHARGLLLDAMQREGRYAARRCG